MYICYVCMYNMCVYYMHILIKCMYYTRMIKKLKFKRYVSIGIEFNRATKSKETRNKILGRQNILALNVRRQARQTLDVSNIRKQYKKLCHNDVIIDMATTCPFDVIHLLSYISLSLYCMWL